MQVDFAISGGRGKDGYVLIASDMQGGRGIISMKSDLDRQYVIESLVFAASGESGDVTQWAEQAAANLKLHAIRNHTALRPAPSAAWIRQSLATSLRSRTPYSVNLLLAGWDPTAGEGEPSVYWIDYLGTMAKVPYSATGYGAYLALSTMDRYHDPEGGLEHGLELLRRCIGEVQKRLIVNLGKFKVRVITAEGVREIDLSPDATPSATAPPPSAAPLPIVPVEA